MVLLFFSFRDKNKFRIFSKLIFKHAKKGIKLSLMPFRQSKVNNKGEITNL